MCTCRKKLPVCICSNGSVDRLPPDRPESPVPPRGIARLIIKARQRLVRIEWPSGISPMIADVSGEMHRVGPEYPLAGNRQLTLLRR
ncbi:hypothetical protein K0M31_010435, partial [Melipona bicolor]